jgi:hypothetical protein
MKKLLVLSTFFLSNFLHAQEDTTLKEYTGKYNFPEGSVVAFLEVTIQDGSLFGNSPAGGATLSKISRDTFSIPSYSGMVYFIRNADNKIKSLRLVVNELDIEGTKENSTGWLKRKKPPHLVR